LPSFHRFSSSSCLAWIFDPLLPLPWVMTILCSMIRTTLLTFVPTYTAASEKKTKIHRLSLYARSGLCQRIRINTRLS
jgi:hypothetical protein